MQNTYQHIRRQMKYFRKVGKNRFFTITIINTMHI